MPPWRAWSATRGDSWLPFGLGISSADWCWQRRLRSWCCRRKQRPTRPKGDKRVQATRFAYAAPRFQTSTASGPACTGTRRSLVLAAGVSSAPGHTGRRQAAGERQAGNCAKVSKREDADGRALAPKKTRLVPPPRRWDWQTQLRCQYRRQEGRRADVPLRPKRAPELRFRGLHFFAGTIPGFVLKFCVGRCVAMSRDRAARYRRLALKEPDKEKAELLRLLADEADRGVLVTTEWLSARPYKKVEISEAGDK